MRKKKALFLTCLLAVSFGLTALVAFLADRSGDFGRAGDGEDDMLVVTSFYPVQLLAESVAEGVDGVEVVNLTENHGGCLHDYTITTKDMRLLSEAELFLVNGGGMELFLGKVAKEHTGLVIADTTAGYEFLEGVAHNHAHSHDEEPEGDHEDHDHTEEEQEVHAGEHDADVKDAHDEHAVNAHVWLDIDGYLYQLSKVEAAFAAEDPANTLQYRANAERCREELLALKESFAQAKTQLAGNETVVFHEGFVYLFHMVGIETVHCIAMDGDTQIASGEAAEVVEECNIHGIDRMFAEEEYAKSVRDTFAGDFNGSVVVLDALTGKTVTEVETVGTGIAVYCNRMKANLNRIMQAYGLR